MKAIVAILIMVTMLTGCGDSKSFAEEHPDYSYDLETRSYVKEKKIANMSNGCALYDVDYAYVCIPENPDYRCKNYIRVVKCPTHSATVSYQQGKGNQPTIVFEPMD